MSIRKSNGNDVEEKSIEWLRHVEALSCKSKERPRIAIVSFRAEKAKLSNVLFGRRTATIGITEEQCCIAVQKKRVEMRRQGSV